MRNGVKITVIDDGNEGTSVALVPSDKPVPGVSGSRTTLGRRWNMFTVGVLLGLVRSPFLPLTSLLISLTTSTIRV